MSREKKIGDIVIYILSLLIMLGIMGYFLQRKEPPQIYNADLRQSFDLQINRSPVEKSDQKGELRLRSDDEVLLIGNLPRLPRAAFINLHVLYSSVEVFVGEERIYAYGVDRQKQGLPLGCGYHSVPLPEGYQDRPISLRLVPADSYKLSYVLQHLSLGEKDMLTSSSIDENRFPFSTALFLLTLGCVLFFLFILFFFVGNSEEARAMAYLSLFTFCIGLWGLGSLNFIQVFSDDILINSYMEFFAFYALFPGWLFVVSDLRKNRRFDRWFFWNKVFFCAFYLLIVALQLLHIRNYTFFLPFYHLFCLISVVISIAALTDQFSLQSRYEKVLCIGTIVITIIFCSQVLLYNISKYLSFSMAHPQNLVIYLNMLIVVITFVLSYGMRFSDKTVSKREIALLEKMAFQDSLTGLGNRQSGVIRLLEYERDKQHYRLLLYDLNNLKLANDLGGHSKGDEMLRDFSDTLREVFDRGETIVRLGGDEFLVIEPMGEEIGVQTWRKALRERLREINREKKGEIPIEVAYGEASTYEMQSFHYEELLKRADERMYQNKKQVKAGERGQLV